MQQKNVFSCFTALVCSEPTQTLHKVSFDVITSRYFFFFKILQPLKFVWQVIDLPKALDLAPSSMRLFDVPYNASFDWTSNLFVSLVLVGWMSGCVSLLNLFTKTFFFSFFSFFVCADVNSVGDKKTWFICLQTLPSDKVLIYGLLHGKMPLGIGNKINVGLIASCFFADFLLFIYCVVK